jgi:hypothetical protein
MIYHKNINIPVTVRTIYPRGILAETINKYQRIFANLYNDNPNIEFSKNPAQQSRYIEIAKAPRLLEFPIHSNLIGNEVKEWLKSLGLCLINGVIHNRPPNTQTGLHIDYDGKIGNRDVAKMNFVFSSYGAKMEWFKLKEDTNLGNGDGVSTQFSIDDVTSEYECIADSHCILNGAEIHKIEVGNNRGIDRVCYSFWLGRIPESPDTSFDPYDATPIDWDTCLEIFKPYFKD